MCICYFMVFKFVFFRSNKKYYMASAGRCYQGGNIGSSFSVFSIGAFGIQPSSARCKQVLKKVSSGHSLRTKSGSPRPTHSPYSSGYNKIPTSTILPGKQFIILTVPGQIIRPPQHFKKLLLYIVIFCFAEDILGELMGERMLLANCHYVSNNYL